MGAAWAQVAEYAGAALLLAGALVTLAAGIGLVRLPDLFTRMHAASKPQLLGLLLLCAGTALSLHTWQAASACALVVAIQVIGAPLGSHMIGRTAYRTGLSARSELVVDELERDQADQVPHRSGHHSP